jgi:hypothetical protein
MGDPVDVEQAAVEVFHSALDHPSNVPIVGATSAR